MVTLVATQKICCDGVRCGQSEAVRQGETAGEARMRLAEDRAWHSHREGNRWVDLCERCRTSENEVAR